MSGATPRPTFGTCLSCTQALRLDARGALRKHTTKVTVDDGSMLLTIRCPGSGEETAQSLGVIYDTSPHRRCWVCVTCDETTCTCPTEVAS